MKCYECQGTGEYEPGTHWCWRCLGTGEVVPAARCIRCNRVVDGKEAEKQFVEILPNIGVTIVMCYECRHEWEAEERSY